jgi:carboxymethylenebutenolidase
MTPTQPDGYLAAPHGGSGAGVLVLHAWWGLNDTIKGVCDRLAAEGFTAFAPDLYHGKLAHTIPDAEAAVQGFNADPAPAQADIATAIEFLQGRAAPAGQGLAVIGFSFGAAFALDAAATRPDAIRQVVLFYGTSGGDFSRARAAYQGHFAENDPYEPAAGVDELAETLQSAGRTVSFYRYPGTGHWFFEPDRPEAYNPAAANLAWERMLAFLRHAPGA